MAKQLAILIDASGSMFHSAGNGSSKDKIVEASESVQYIIDEIENKTSSSDETWAVSFWYFATQSKGLIGQGNFPVGDTTAWKNVVSAIEDQPSVQAAVGSMTDIFHAVRTVADFMVANPPPLFPAVYKKKIVLTGLGLPSQMKKYVHDGTVKQFALWNPEDLGYLAGYAISALADGFRRMGADIDEQADGFHIRGGRQLRGGEVDAHNDHRLAMAFAVAALGASGPTTIHDAGAAAVSYPEFFSVLQSLRA